MKEVRPIRPDIDTAEPGAPALRGHELSVVSQAIPGILEHAILYRAPRRLTDQSFWHYHIPFAFLLMALARPRLLVELGTHKGDSYSAFCQAVDELALPTKCYAVDTWRGDIHTGHYGDEVLQDLRAHHDPLYARFSTLLQRTFDEAAGHFRDGSIDLLHIDGTHTYEQVRHDWETWLPKLSERAIVLMHDTNVREQNFGVWQVWDELRELYPSREFKYGNGLGVLAVGDRHAPIVKALFALTPDQWTQLEQVFFALGNRVALLGRETSSRDDDAATKAAAAVALADEQALIAGLQKQAADLNSRTAVLQSEVLHRKAEVDSLQAEASHLKGEVRALQTETADLKAENAELRDKLQAAGAAILELRLTVQSRDKAIASSDVTIRRLEEKIASLDKAIAAGEAARAAVEDQTAEGHRAIADRDRTIDERNRQLAEIQARVVDLSGALGAAQAQLQLIINSRSWRLIRPLRVLRRGLAKYRTELRQRLAPGEGTLSAIPHPLPVLLEAGAAMPVPPAQTVAFVPAPAAAPEPPQPVEPDQTGPEYIAQVLATARRSAPDDYVPRATDSLDAQRLPVKTIAFYLPQYHPIPENDAWWGKGFTEWTNVSKAVPQYVGHYQPHLPGEFGFYDLRLIDVMRQQAALARQYGIGGFCFHHYWFAGKRLLDLPVRQFLAAKDIDLPFCLCWANENWTRRWDGLDGEILMAQKHTPEDDLAFIDDVIPMFRDPRYIRFGGRPVLIVYRASLMPDPAATAERWRKRCLEAGVGDPYLVAARSFDIKDPRPFGFDAAVEFPPHQFAVRRLNDEVKIINPQYKGAVYDYHEMAEIYGTQREEDYPLIKCVMPSWDNEPRKPGSGHTFHGSSPAAYGKWLSSTLQDTLERVDASRDTPPFVFINAWNEWGEGAHLEPDRRYGYAYLEATRKALRATLRNPLRTHSGRRLVLVTHDAHPHGAQYLALNFAKHLTEAFGTELDIVCLGEGPLKAEYAHWGRLHDLTGLDPKGLEAVALARALHAAGHRTALVNTTVSGGFLETLALNGIACTALIHELPGVIERRDLTGEALTIAEHASKIVFPAPEVAAGFAKFAVWDDRKTVIRPQGCYKRIAGAAERGSAHDALRRHLGLLPDSVVILGIGSADHRKGVDLFVNAGLKMAAKCPEARWVWVGGFEYTMQVQVEQMLSRAPDLRNRFIFPGFTAETEMYYRGADVFALTSREDPFPSVVLEAMQAGLPIVAFAGAGGFTSLLEKGSGVLVPQSDTRAFADAVLKLIEDPAERERMGKHGRESFDGQFSFHNYVFDVLKAAGHDLRRVSVVVPNYNYSRYLKQRLGSILSQTYPVFEIILLDDASSDDSVEVARHVLGSANVDWRVVCNETNSGSVFSQWQKGISLARGDYVWIAEADDFAEPGFLAATIDAFRDPDVVLSYAQSRQIDSSGALLDGDYLEWVADVDRTKWRSDYRSAGTVEIAEALSVKNTIPNVSAAVFRRAEIARVLDDNIETLRHLRNAGDWFCYLELLRNGAIAFAAAPLNNHRRHASSVTISASNRNHLDEISAMQQLAASIAEVSAAKRAAARRFHHTVARQFGLDDTP